MLLPIMIRRSALLHPTVGVCNSHNARTPTKVGGPLQHAIEPWAQPCREGAGELPASVERFISKLPAALEAGQPAPDVDYVVDILLQSALVPAAPAAEEPRVGSKRPHAATNGGGSMPPRQADLFQLRQRVKTENGAYG